MSVPGRGTTVITSSASRHHGTRPSASMPIQSRPATVRNPLQWLPSLSRHKPVCCGAMKVEVLMAANSAKHDGWLLDVSGAGWEYYTCPTFPYEVRGALAGIVILEDSDLGMDHQLHFKIEAVDDGDIGFLTDNTYHVAKRGPAAEGIPSRMPFAVPFSFRIEAPRVMRAVVLKGDVDLGEVTFKVRAS